MGQIAHLRNQFKSKNTFTQSYDYIVSLIWREKQPIISILQKHWVPFTHGCFVSSLVEKIFKISSFYFHYFVIISPWQKTWHFIWINLNLLHPRMLCVKFGWNWPSGSGEDENVKSLQMDRWMTGDQKNSLQI